jgi:BNR repeat-containing family member
MRKYRFISLDLLFMTAYFLISAPDVRAQQDRLDGYRGIWFTLGQPSEYGDKYSGGLGTYTANHMPTAIYDRGSHRTFFVYGGSRKDGERHLYIMISYFDHRTGMLPRPVVVMDKLGVDDPHDNASLSMDGLGYLWVFVSGRNVSRPGKIFRSRQPRDISTFEELLTASFTYPQPWFLGPSGFLLMYTRYTKGRELYFRNIDLNGTPGAERKLAGMGGHYQLSHYDGQRIMTVFNYHPGGNVDKRTNVYFMQSLDTGLHWTTILGDTLSLPVSDTRTAAIVREYARDSLLVYLNDLTVDRFGNPVVLAVISRDFRPGPAGDPRKWVVLHWKDGRWLEHEVCRSTHNYDMGSLYVQGRRWRIIGPTEAGPQRWGTGGEMAIWESHDEGENWIRKRQLTVSSKRNHSYARRPINAHSDFEAFWADGHADSLSSSHLYFCDRRGRVFLMPTMMQAEMESPRRVYPYLQ